MANGYASDQQHLWVHGRGSIPTTCSWNLEAWNFEENVVHSKVANKFVIYWSSCKHRSFYYVQVK
jgi:hypothetical protein